VWTGYRAARETPLLPTSTAAAVHRGLDAVPDHGLEADRLGEGQPACRGLTHDRRRERVLAVLLR
jgi:hypothetical protein